MTLKSSIRIVLSYFVFCNPPIALHGTSLERSKFGCEDGKARDPMGLNVSPCGSLPLPCWFPHTGSRGGSILLYPPTCKYS